MRLDTPQKILAKLTKSQSKILKKRYSVTKIPLDRMGYDRRGNYYGNDPGTHIWLVTDEHDGRSTIIRASNAETARARAIAKRFVRFGSRPTDTWR